LPINLPVSDTEYQLHESVVLVTKTDLYGKITYFNKSFTEVTGFTETELIGNSDNMFRHPDMPQHIVDDMWELLTADNNWQGTVKHRRKNGDYFWVEANVTPLYEQNKKIGYVSLRYKASKEQIARALENIKSGREKKITHTIPKPFNAGNAAEIQARLTKRIMALETYRDSIDQEQIIAAAYMNNLIAVDKLQDPAVQFYLKPAANFSGDLIAIARTPDNKLHLMLADSTGHGLYAALAAMPVIHPFYSMTGKGFNISVIAQEINKKVRASLPVSHFVAAIIVSIDSARHMVEVWSGGCPPPFILNSRGERVYQFKPRHLAMGILPPEQFDASVEYYSYDNDDSSLVMFSDGVIEMENEDGERFGVESLLEAVQVEGSTTRWNQAMRRIESYCGDNDHEKDDIALMMVRCESGPNYAMNEILPKKESEEIIDGNVVWRFEMMLTMQQIRKLNVVPLLLEIVQRIEKDKERGGEIFMVLSELFNNALDHGVLKLASSLKHSEDGMEKYFEERAERLANINTGHIQLNLQKVLGEDGSALLRIQVIDSGEGFDFERVSKEVTNNTSLHGRGVVLLFNVCRSVQYFNGGSEVVVEFDLNKSTHKSD
jgi:PAS domain S-box-containing protein